MSNHLKSVSRRSILAGVAVLSAAAAQRRFNSRAQDEAPAAVASPSAGIGSIRPTGVGEVPSTGASRPGPADLVRERMIAVAVAPVGLSIESAGVDAGIEALRVVDGAM